MTRRPAGIATARHDTGVTWTSADVEDAAALLGWPGWAPVTDTQIRPVGVDCTGARTIADLCAYAEAMGVELGAARKRAEVETAIAAHHEVGR